MAIATVSNNTYTVEALYRWDHGQTLAIYGLSLPSVPEIRFCHKGADRAIVRAATMDAAGIVRAEIPDSLLQEAYTIWAYIGLYEGDAFRTYHKIEIPVKDQAKPLDYTLEDSPEVYSFEQMENQVNGMDAKIAAQNAKVAEATQAATNATSAATAATAKVTEALEALAEAEEAMAGVSVVTLTHTKSGKAHALTGLGSKTGLVSAQFKASAVITAGDTLTVDGVTYAAQMTNGDALETDFWAVGAVVGCIVDTAGKTVNFKGGGGAKLPALTKPAGAEHILAGYEAINGEGVLLPGSLGSGITNAATAAQISTGYQAILADGRVVTGTNGAAYGLVSQKLNTNQEEGDTYTVTVNIAPAKVRAVIAETSNTLSTRGFIVAFGPVTSDASITGRNDYHTVTMEYSTSTSCKLICKATNSANYKFNYWIYYEA